MGPAQETRMDAISRTIQKHTLYSGIHPPSKVPSRIRTGISPRMVKRNQKTTRD
jgi:hypothetical protein